MAPLELNVPKELVHHPRSGVEAASPLVRALLDYERHFCLHLLQARAISETGDAVPSSSSTATSQTPFWSVLKARYGRMSRAWCRSAVMSLAS